MLSKKGDAYYAIQCKYRKLVDKMQIIPWRSLSTFYAIVVKTGPWLKNITMTNVNGCKHIGQKTEKDWSICVGTFRNIDHFAWLKLCDQENSVPESLQSSNSNANKETIRTKRLDYFSSFLIEKETVNKL